VAAPSVAGPLPPSGTLLPDAPREAARPTALLAAAPSLFRISPRAAKLARDCVIDPTRITGTGPSGRVVEKDVRAYLEAKGYDKLRISPAAKQLAAKEKLDILTIEGTGDSGRISMADVERALEERP